MAAEAVVDLDVHKSKTYYIAHLVSWMSLCSSKEAKRLCSYDGEKNCPIIPAEYFGNEAPNNQSEDYDRDSSEDEDYDVYSDRRCLAYIPFRWWPT